MKRSISKHEFISDVRFKDSFTYEGASALFDYFEEWESEAEEELEFDPIGIRCDYSEYTSISQFMSDYDTDDWQVNNIEDFFEILAEHTFFIKINDHHFIILNY